MAKSFLLRFQEEQVTLDSPSAQLAATTGTKVPGEQPDRSAAAGSCGAIPVGADVVKSTLASTNDEKNRPDSVFPHNDTGTKTAVKDEQPDRSAAGEACATLPQQSAAELVNSTLTYTFVNAEQPRKDERRRSALVLPACS
jgi:hypothetical protein